MNLEQPNSPPPALQQEQDRDRAAAITQQTSDKPITDQTPADGSNSGSCGETVVQKSANGSAELTASPSSSFEAWERGFRSDTTPCGDRGL